MTTVFRRRLAMIGLFAVAPLTVTGWTGAGASSLNVKLLLSQAAKDNNTVRTLEYTTQVDITSKSQTIHSSMKGQEDEVANREQDHETALVAATSSTGQKRSVKYTVDIVFINGRTYYRSSLTKNNVWQEKPGMAAIRDPIISTNSWKRGRTKVSFLAANRYTVVSQSPLIHLRAHLTKGAAVAKDDLYFSAGGTPYLLRETLQVTQTVQGQAIVQRTDTQYGPFNKALSIGVPSTGA